MNDERFYGYKHWTLEEIPRCFYVGKGLKSRPFDNRRNKKWNNVSKRFGLRVEICVGPFSNNEAIEWEISNIIAEDTFTTSWETENGSNIRCNFTHGGDGATGHFVSDDAKRRIGNAQRNKPKSSNVKQKLHDALIGRKLSVETRTRMSKAKLGKSLSQEHCHNLWSNRSHIFTEEHVENLRKAAKLRAKPSQETILKRSQGLRGKRHKCSICGLIGHTKPTCPDLRGENHE